MAGESQGQDDKLLYPQSVSFDEDKFTLLLNVNEQDIDLGNISETAVQNGFDQKAEFHITVIGFKTGAAIKQALEKGAEDKRQQVLQNIRSLIAQTSWSFTLLPQRYHIKKEYKFRTDDNVVTELRESYIQMLSMPQINVFYEKLNAIIGINLEPPPPHLTLYTRGDDKERAKAGIGINSKEEFLRLNPKPI